MENTDTVLIIEDDPNIADLVEIHLKDLGYYLERSYDGEEGLAKALEGNYNLIILDLMLPKLEGFEVCKRIRAEDERTPILMLTSKSEELDKVLGLELGADDYLTKPFSIRELIARIKAIFRRIDVSDQPPENGDKEPVLTFEELTIDLEKRKVSKDGETLDLTVKEFDLLALFAKNPGRAYNRQELLDIVWGYSFVGYEHTVNSHINRLRNKIEEDTANPKFIKTVWGVGYRFVEKDELD
ncbi:MAG: response regulator transcription factor [Candidatus Marinimicrobia bacterium]|nr:response regulator transcription factor [Candidatus Neomarinimicrobiota bacterium]MCF7829481.1 response regulator transcription factor [Candidatus Neomarinimicrobiota bacterium]MCF7880121.1 response regulator transcription factor [Candidatus Neomarinimicrobiota bacterium]